jgi:Tol biopolymer transport system component
VSITSSGGQSNGFKDDPGITGDGRYIVFSSSSSNLVAGDTNSKVDVFVHDRTTGTTSRVSVASDGAQSSDTSTKPFISRDGRWVTFDSVATNLVAGDTNALRDIFVHDRQTATTVRASVASDGSQSNGDSDDPTVSADGRYVAFESVASNLVTGNTNVKRDIFVRDTAGGTTELVSVDSLGGPSNNESRGAAISADGRWVAFMSLASDLVSGDTNGKRDVFVHDRQAATITRWSVATDGTQGNGDSTGPAVPSDDGQHVAFLSIASNLVPDDTNGTRDVFVRGPDQ